jgi:hypothetical protein
MKWEKELFYLKRIFDKKEFKRKLPLFSKLRLLSMCYFHLADKSNLKSRQMEAFIFALKSMLLWPQGYNKKSLKPTIVIIIYNIPLLGKLNRVVMNLLNKKVIKS